MLIKSFTLLLLAFYFLTLPSFFSSEKTSWIEGTSKKEQCVLSVVHIIIILRNSPALRTCKFCTLLTVMFCLLPATTNSLCSPWFCVRLPDMIDLVVRWQPVLINGGSAEGHRTWGLSLNSFFVLKDFFVFARHLRIAQRELSCPSLVFNHLFKEKEQPCICALSGVCTNIFLFYTFAMCLSVHPPIYRQILEAVLQKSVKEWEINDEAMGRRATKGPWQKVKPAHCS